MKNNPARVHIQSIGIIRPANINMALVQRPMRKKYLVPLSSRFSELQYGQRAKFTVFVWVLISFILFTPPVASIDPSLFLSILA